MLKKIKKAVLVIFTSIFSFTNYCFANAETELNAQETVSNSVLAIGTEKLITDLTNWLLILAPIVTILMVGYYFFRKGASDEMDGKRWDNRIKIAIISCVGVMLTSGLINLIMSYYR